MSGADARRVNEMLDDYARWFRDSFDVFEEDGCVRIVLPMLDRHNDHMSIYLADGDGPGKIVMSDLGHTVDGLYASGCDVNAEGRRGKFESIVRAMASRPKTESCMSKHRQGECSMTSIC